MLARNIRMRARLAAALLIGALGMEGVSALEPGELSPADIQGFHAYFPVMSPPAKAFGGPGNFGSGGASAFGGSVPGLDTAVNFTGQYYAQGLDPNGNPQTTWYYAMLGNSPELGETTFIDAPIIPVSVELLDQEGEQRYVRGARLFVSAHHLVNLALGSPIFQNHTYTSSRTPTQFGDAVQRAEFWDVLDEGESDWHTILNPSVKKSRLIKVPYGFYTFVLDPDGRCCAFISIDVNTFVSLVFPPTYPVDNTTLIGAAELDGDMTTKTIATLLFGDVYLYLNGDPKQCCAGGFHSLDLEPGIPANGNLTRLYPMIYTSWPSAGVFSVGADVLPLSHEVAETFNDLLVGFDGVHNVTPWWLASGPGGAVCSDLMEVGDVLEVAANPSYPITLGGFTYHVQTVALLPWFEFKKRSHAIDEAYSYPDTTLLTALSPPEKVNCQ